MKRFNIETAIYFGEGSLEKLRELDNKKILIVCDKFIGTSDILKKDREVQLSVLSLRT